MDFIRTFKICNWRYLLYMTVLFVTTSCVFQQQYPSKWPKIDNGKFVPLQGCPNIIGIYQDLGVCQPNNACEERDWDKRSLIYNLLSKERDQLRLKGHVSIDVEHLIGNTIEIKQHPDNLLEIIVWKTGAEDPFMISHDFIKNEISCDLEGLHLKKRYDAQFAIISNAVCSTSRTLNRCEDGSLVMKCIESAVGHHTFVPIGMSREHWIRWMPISDFSP